MRLLPSAPPASAAGRVPGRAPAWQRRYRRHRRALAAVLAGVVAWGVVTAVRPPAPQTAPTVVAARDLVPGSVLRAEDVVTRSRPTDGRPVDAATSAGTMLGRTVAFPVRAGEPVTARHLLGAELLTALGPGLVATPVTLADAISAALVAPGDLVDVLAASPSGAESGTSTASVVASRVRVLVAPTSTATSSGALLGAAGGDGRSGAPLVLATTTEQALAIASAAVGSRLSLTMRPR